MNPFLKKRLFILKKRTETLYADVLHRLRKPYLLTPSSALLSEKKLSWKNDFRKYDYEAVAIDFGCGNGNFSIAYAKENPNSLVIGCDIATEYLLKGVRKAERIGLSNCKFVQADGIWLLKTCIAKKSLKHIFINFPDPWHKKRHSKRRLFTPAFFSLSLKLLEKDGILHFISDNEGIYQFALKNALQTINQTHWHLTETTPPDWYPRSKYWEKWRSQERIINYFCIS